MRDVGEQEGLQLQLGEQGCDDLPAGGVCRLHRHLDDVLNELVVPVVDGATDVQEVQLVAVLQGQQQRDVGVL